MKYDFDRIIDRSQTNSVKWDKDFLKKKFGTDDILPLWVADMDFQCPQPMIDALKKRVETWDCSRYLYVNSNVY